MHLLSCVVQRRQEVCYGALLSRPDVVPVAGLCPVLHGPQFCLLAGLRVGPDGGRGPQVHDTPGPLCLLPPAGSQQLGTVPGRAPLEPERRHGPLGHTGREQARGHAASAWGVFARHRHHLGGQDRQADAGGPKVERPQRQCRPRRVSDRPPLELGGAHQPVGSAVAVLASGHAAGAGPQRGATMDRRRGRRAHELLGCRHCGHLGGDTVFGRRLGAGGSRCLLLQSAVSQWAAGAWHPGDQPPAQRCRGLGRSANPRRLASGAPSPAMAASGPWPAC